MITSISLLNTYRKIYRLFCYLSFIFRFQFFTSYHNCYWIKFIGIPYVPISLRRISVMAPWDPRVPRRRPTREWKRSTGINSGQTVQPMGKFNHRINRLRRHPRPHTRPWTSVSSWSCNRSWRTSRKRKADWSEWSRIWNAMVTRSLAERRIRSE